MVVAVVAALAAGCAFALASVLQQQAARSAPQRDSLSPRLLLGLARRRDWLIGFGAAVLSFGLQALALAFGPLSLVQPLIVCELLFAIPISVRIRQRRLGAREWGGTLAVAGGLALFLTVAAPGAGRHQPSGVIWLATVAAAGTAAGVSVGAGRLVAGPIRPSLYAVAAATLFGLQAALVKAATTLLGQGAVAFFTGWQPYALAVVAPLGVLLEQSAFNAGPLAASLPVIDAVEPAVAILIGVVAFGETVGSAPLRLAAEAVGVAVLTAGIVLLDTSPLIQRLQQEDKRDSGPGRRGSRSRTAPRRAA